jgi:hypothetical protein
VVAPQEAATLVPLAPRHPAAAGVKRLLRRPRAALRTRQVPPQMCARALNIGVPKNSTQMWLCFVLNDARSCVSAAAAQEPPGPPLRSRGGGLSAGRGREDRTSTTRVSEKVYSLGQGSAGEDEQ